MSREIRNDGAGALQIRFPYDRELVAQIKTLPRRRWNAEGRFWWVPEQDVVLVVDLLLPWEFRCDPATRESYGLRGGTAALPEAAPRDSAVLPGLFDEPPAAGPAAAAGEGLTVSELNGRVRRAIESAFPEPVWLIGEISGFNRNAHKRHVSFQLVEHDEAGRNVSAVEATLFEQKRRDLERALRAAGDPFRLEDEIRVRVRVRVDLYVPWGSYRVVVEDLDLTFTLGEAARRREEIVRRLAEEGLLGRNLELPMPEIPLRVGLITSLGSDAYNDVLRTLQESGFAFSVLAHGARVQGRSTEPSVLNALEALGRLASELDVVVVCRGGGSRTDLAWLDSLALGRAVARFPLPVLVGIGHEQDRSVLDEIGWRCKTPTAAGSFLVERVRSWSERLGRGLRDLLGAAAVRLGRERREGRGRGRRLALAVRGLLERERLGLAHRRERTARAARGRLEAVRGELARRARGLPGACSVLLARREEAMAHASRAIAHAARRDVAAETRRLADAARALGPRAGRLLVREEERHRARERRLHLVHPRRVIERGYAIMRVADGPALRDPAAAPPGTEVRAELAGGRLRLRSEGRDDGAPGEPPIGGGNS